MRIVDLAREPAEQGFSARILDAIAQRWRAASKA